MNQIPDGTPSTAEEVKVPTVPEAPPLIAGTVLTVKAINVRKDGSTFESKGASPQKKKGKGSDYWRNAMAGMTPEQKWLLEELRWARAQVLKIIQVGNSRRWTKPSVFEAHLLEETFQSLKQYPESLRKYVASCSRPASALVTPQEEESK